MTKKRCPWANHSLEIEYHDHEWGKPQHEDLVLFEFLVLEIMQAGLSWLTILKKRENFRKALSGFKPKIIAKYDRKKIESLLQDETIIRNRLKIEAVLTNAQVFLEVQKEFGSFDQYIWKFVDHRPIQNKWSEISQIPAKTGLSDLISKDMKKRGFKFVGPIGIYAFLQSVGIVNDHLLSCPSR